MRTAILAVTCVLFLFVETTSAQRRSVSVFNPTAELSFSITGGETRAVYRLESEGQEYTSQSESSSSYAMLSLRPGLFFAPWLSFEPEMLLIARSGAAPAHALVGNFAFMFLIPRTPVAPFAYIGYGAGNGVPHVGRLEGRESDKPWDVRIANAGGGVKFFVMRNGAIRVEYRFQMAMHERSVQTAEYSYTWDQTWYMNDLLVGVSLFL